MITDDERFPAELWPYLTYWQRKRIYYLTVWYVFKSKAKKFFKALIVQAKAFLQKRPA